MKYSHKQGYPLADIRRFLEPGPVVLISSSWRAQRNIMTLGWHMMMGFEPALVGCYISPANYSFGLLRRSRECVINLPTQELLDTVVKIGNCSGAEVDKFSAFGLTAVAGTQVAAPLIRECYANFECRLRETRLSADYSLFIWEVVCAQVAMSPKRPVTIHYRGGGEFMLSGGWRSRRRLFKPDML